MYPDEWDHQRIAFRTRDLSRDPYMRWLETYHYLPGAVVGVALLAIGGWTLFLWAFCFRLVLLYHSTWMVNSAAHVSGYRTFPDATGHNNWFVALMTFGEGWHNNHHAWPSSARQGLQIWELDVSWWVISTLRRLGLAREVTHVSLDSASDQGGVLLRS